MESMPHEARPAELPDEPAPDLTIEIAFQPFDENDPPLRAFGSIAVHPLGLLITGFEIRQWPGVNDGLVRVDFPRPRYGRSPVVAWNLRLRDLIARAYTEQAAARVAAKLPVYCCPAVALFTTEKPVHTPNCKHGNRWVPSLGRGVWSKDDLECLAAQLLDTFAAGKAADVCRTLARLTPIEAALVTVRILAPAPYYAEAAPELNPAVLAEAFAEDLEQP